MTGSPARVWAPFAERVDLVTAAGSEPLRAEGGGWFGADRGLGHGERYGFCLDGGPVRPDPRAVWLPDGVHGPAAGYRHSRFAWTDAGWAGRSWPQAVLYELHVGTFTPQGTFDAAAARLPHLVDLGVSHVELMPVCAFDGVAGWGYDGVAPWAVHEPYGGPDGLKRFVDAAHDAGLAVLLDVVHNHLGPRGSYLAEFGPYFTDRYRTPWGAAVNLDEAGSDEVRGYLLGSIEAWLRDFHLDGLRLDAVHELRDNRAVTFLEEVSVCVDALAVELGRPLVVVAESDRNDPRTVTPRSEHGLGLTAQWDDDVHHAVHVLLTGEAQGYYADFAADTATAVRKALTGAFVHDGTYSSFRGRTHGRAIDRAAVPGYRFVAALQTHDQVGNRARGERLSMLVGPGPLAAGAALVLLGPYVPMLFMGEEWGAATPWQFFSSFDDPVLAATVTRGRRDEFVAHGWPTGDVPDPQHPATVARSVLDWDEPAHQPHADLLGWYRRLLQLRREVPDLHDPDLRRVQVDVPAAGRTVVLHRGRHRVLAAAGQGPADVRLDAPVGTVLAALCPDGAAEVDGTRVLLPGPGAVVLALTPP
jgi:maltooligosyltrehalose trehalohydrolase